MREILFRGKSVNSGQWLFGDYMGYGGTAQIWEQTSDGKWNAIVDPSTIGQYTGLTDKNGVKIFDGDIVSVVQGRDKGTATISYENGSFVAVPVTGNIYERTLWDYWYNDWEIQLIGNIHDNQELTNET